MYGSGVPVVTICILLYLGLPFFCNPTRAFNYPSMSESNGSVSYFYFYFSYTYFPFPAKKGDDPTEEANTEKSETSTTSKQLRSTR
jgi:hypothetical protein